MKYATQNGSSLLLNLLHTHALSSLSFCYAIHHTIPVPLAQISSLCPLFSAMLYAMQNLWLAAFVVDFDNVRGHSEKYNRLNKPIAWKNEAWKIQKVIECVSQMHCSVNSPFLINISLKIYFHSSFSFSWYFSLSFSHSLNGSNLLHICLKAIPY